MAPFSYFTEQSLQALHQSKGFRNFFQHINFTTEFSAKFSIFSNNEKKKDVFTFADPG